MLVDVGDEHRRLGGDQAEGLQDGQFFLAEGDRSTGPGLVERGLALDEHVDQPRRFLVVARLGRLQVALQALLDGRQVGQAELGLDDLDVGDRVDLAGDVDHVLVVEAAHHVDDRVGLADVRQELVSEALALGRAGHQPGDVDELDHRRQHALGLDDRRQRGQPRVGQLDDADVRLDGAERVVLGGDAGFRQRVEKGGLADVGQAHDAAFEAHGGGFRETGKKGGRFYAASAPRRGPFPGAARTRGRCSARRGAALPGHSASLQSCTMERFDVCVRGAGIVGHCLALSLARQGLQVALVSEAPGAAAAAGRADDVRAYALNAASVGLLDRLKVWDALPAHAATAVHDMHIEGDAAGAGLDFSAWEQRVGELAWIVDAAVLERQLADAVRFAPHVSRAAAARGCGRAGGRADGAVRRQGVGDAQRAGRARASATTMATAPSRRGWSPTRPHLNCARQWFRAPDVLALLPLDTPEPGRSFALVWSLPDERAEGAARARRARVRAGAARSHRRRLRRRCGSPPSAPPGR